MMNIPENKKKINQMKGCYLVAVLSDERYLNSFVDRLAEKGIKKFDDLSRFSEREIFALAATSTENQRRFKDALLDYGISLN